MRLVFGFSLKNPSDAFDFGVPRHKCAVTVTLINALRVRADHSDLDSAERFAIDNSSEQSKFEVGLSTNFMVVQAQRDLFDAQISELRAVLNYSKSLVDLERVQLTGTGGSVSSISSGGSTGVTTSASTTAGR